MKNIKSTLLISSLFCAFIIYTNAEAKELEMSKSVPVKNTQVCNAEISFPFGEIAVASGTKYLLDADFEFKREMWRPRLEIESDKRITDISVSAPDGKKLKQQKEEDQSEWDIKLNRKVKYNLEIKIAAGEGSINLSESNTEKLLVTMGAGEIDMDLSNSTIDKFKFSMGAGEAFIDFSGINNHNFEGKITGAVGEVTIVLPKGIDVRVKVTGLLGEVNYNDLDKDGSIYTSKDYGKTDSTFMLDIFGVVGEVKLKIEE